MGQEDKFRKVGEQTENNYNDRDVEWENSGSKQSSQTGIINLNIIRMSTVQLSILNWILAKAQHEVENELCLLHE